MSTIKPIPKASTAEKEPDDHATGDSSINDIGADLYAEAGNLSAEELEQEGGRVRKILDWRIMPIVCYPNSL